MHQEPSLRSDIDLSLDYLSLDGANGLCEKIRSYWAERGFRIQAWVETRPYNAVRSDLLGGFPRDYRPSQKSFDAAGPSPRL